MNLQKPFNSLGEGTIGEGSGGQGRYTGAQPKGILQNASPPLSEKLPAMPGTGCIRAYFPGKSPSWCFATPNLLSTKIS